MQKDMKIGMILGVVLVGVIGVYIATLPSLSLESRMRKKNGLGPEPNQPRQQDVVEDPPRMTAFEPEQLQPESKMDEGNEVLEVEQVVETAPAETNVQPEPQYVEQEYKVQKFYIIRKGDTLSKISRKYYGTPDQWYRIHQANKDVLPNPDKLKRGMKLIIPE